jgi:pimeloyl-ACP methyl ester carboxylesterase
MFQEHIVDSGGSELNVAVGPNTGPPLVLLHGITRKWQDFVPLVSELVPRWQVFALDFRGHGRSARVPGRYRLADFVRDAVTVLHDVVQEPAVIYGHSMGALAALAGAALAAWQVRAVVLEDPPAPRLLATFKQSPFFSLFAGLQALAGRKEPVAELTRLVADIHIPTADGSLIAFGELRDPTSLRFTARCLQDLDPEVLTPLLEGRWLEGYDVEALCKAVQVPVLLLRGDEKLGGMMPREDGSQLAGRLADCTVVDVPGVGHLLHWLARETVLRLTLGFLEALPDKAPAERPS